MTNQSQDDGPTSTRAQRFESHALVDIRVKWWNPFSVVSAVLLDLSWQGFKVEFVNPLSNIRAGEKLYMSIPLAPFSVMSPTKLTMRLEVKWFDPKTLRMGGIFVDPTHENAYILEKIIHKVSQSRKV